MCRFGNGNQAHIVECAEPCGTRLKCQVNSEKDLLIMHYDVQ